MAEILLALETATDVCSVAVTREDTVLAAVTIARPRVHSELLTESVVFALKAAGLSLQDLSAIAVSMGPGSYTGLRIGASTAKGIAWSADLPLIGVPTLEAIAFSAIDFSREGDSILACLRARREEVFSAVYRVERDQVQQTRDTQADSYDALNEWLSGSISGTVWLAGECSQAISRSAGLRPDLHVQALPERITRPSAESVARAARHRWNGAVFEDISSFEPFYLKEFVTRKSSRIFDRLPDMHTKKANSGDRGD